MDSKHVDESGGQLKSDGQTLVVTAEDAKCALEVIALLKLLDLPSSLTKRFDSRINQIAMPGQSMGMGEVRGWLTAEGPVQQQSQKSDAEHADHDLELQILQPILSLQFR